MSDTVSSLLQALVMAVMETIEPDLGSCTMVAIAAASTNGKHEQPDPIESAQSPQREVLPLTRTTWPASTGSCGHHLTALS